ncbi:MAG: family 43 glycosylhydrolase [Clostridia bacterium]|nr:family 43 glycosylhydrolase [Clostridia bacterium]
MNFKKIISLLIACIMPIGIFSSCAPNAITLGDTELAHYDYSDPNRQGYNTELFYQNACKIPLGDPAILPVTDENGEVWYYLTGTTAGNNFEMWKTKDFTNWDYLGNIYTPPRYFYGVESFWAPQLMYDPDADWQYYLGEDAGEGKGLYLLCFSARKTTKDCQITVTFSKKIDGPYKHCTRTNADGDSVGPRNPIFMMSKLEGLGLYDDHIYGPLYKEGRGFIDACPFIDPVTGEKYMYMVRNRVVDKSNDVWGIKMKDWITPDYTTTAPLTSYGFTTIDQETEYGYQSRNNIDEGPFMYYKDGTDNGKNDGKYYLTLSIGDTNDKLYPVCQAIGDSPLGPFTKIQPEHGGLLACPQTKEDIHGCGHHAFFEIGGELFIGYHTYEITDTTSIGGRFFGLDKVEWMYNDVGQYIMHSNGPAKSIQPLPSASSGYENLAPSANVTVSGNLEKSNIARLNDRLIAHSESDLAKEFSSSEDVVITLDFEDYITARAIMIYNSLDSAKAFDNISRIEFYYRKEVNGTVATGMAYINDLGYDKEGSLIPKDYLEYKEETNFDQIRPCSASIAEFDELEVNCIKIFVKKPAGKTEVNISEIVVLGKSAS